MPRLEADHIGLSVGDLEASAEFYCRAFGYEREFEFEFDQGTIRGLMLHHPGGLRLELFERPGSVPGIQAETSLEALRVRGYGHVALAAVPIDSAFETAVAAGARAVREPWHSPARGMRLAFLADPEGNLIELVEREG